jgi:hypothetical protein
MILFEILPRGLAYKCHMTCEISTYRREFCRSGAGFFVRERYRFFAGGVSVAWDKQLLMCLRGRRRQETLQPVPAMWLTEHWSLMLWVMCDHLVYEYTIIHGWAWQIVHSSCYELYPTLQPLSSALSGRRAMITLAAARIATVWHHWYFLFRSNSAPQGCQAPDLTEPIWAVKQCTLGAAM